MFTRKTLKTSVGVAIIIVVPMLPGLALAASPLKSASGTWMLAAVTATLASLLVGARLGIVVGLGLTAASFLGYLATGDPWLAMIVMACSAGLYGLSSRLGVHTAISMAPISLAFIMAERIPILDGASVLENALLTALVVLSATLWSVPIGWFMGKRIPHRVLHPLNSTRAHAFAIVIAVVAGTAMWVVVHFDWKHGGAWFLLTLFVVIQPNMHATWIKSLQRALGTILGFAIAYVISVVITAEWLLYIAGLICLGTAVFMYINPKRNYWQYATFLTPAIVILEGTSNSIVSTGLQRLRFTLLGVLVSLVVLALLVPIFGRSPRPAHPTHEEQHADQ
jgi:hypothetical protein